MKHLLLAGILTALFFGSSHAQTEKGTILLGGGMLFQTSSGSSTFSATPNIGIFVLNDVATSAKLTILSQTDAGTKWAIGPSIRLYLFGTDRGKFIVQSGVNVGGAKNSSTDFGFDFGAGYAAFLNRSIALELLANFTKTGDIKGIFSMGAGFQIHYRK